MSLIDVNKLKETIQKSVCQVTCDEPRGCNYCKANEVFNVIYEAPTVEAIPVDWIKKYEKFDDLAASIYRMLEAWGADLSEWEEQKQ